MQDGLNFDSERDSDNILCVQCFTNTGYYNITFFNKEDVQTRTVWNDKKAKDPMLEAI